MKRSPISSWATEIADRITNTFDRKKIFATSSFQTQSIPLLHIISQIDKDIPVYFLNTGYHFPDTLSFKKYISDLLGLNVIDLFSSIPKNQQRNEQGNLLFASDPDYCCYLNKVKPLEPILMEYDVWISGVRADQSTNRQSFKKIDKGPYNTLQYHPMINWTEDDINRYINEYKLPRHPLHIQGYSSIGCMPCTRKVDPEYTDERAGRWKGLSKTECGLHNYLVDEL